MAKRERPKLIVAGATAYPRLIDAQPFREIADAVGARLMFDIAHPAGLVAGGAHPNPVGVADVVTLTTHKTLRGPRGGAILCRARVSPRRSTRPCSPGSRADRSSTSSRPRRWPFGEASPARRSATTPRRSWPTPAPWPTALAAEGFRLVSGGTDNHLLLVDLRPFDAELTGKEAQEVLDRAGITLNRNTIPDDPRSPFVTSGLRLGTRRPDHGGHGAPGDGGDRRADRPGACASRTDDDGPARRAGRGARAVRRVPALPRARRGRGAAPRRAGGG